MIFLVSISAVAQKSETFDIISFKTPAGWQKDVSDNSVQFAIEDKAKGAICMITLFKPLPGGNDAKVNFDTAWETIVKGLVTVQTAPEMQPSVKENGWTVETGHALYESDGIKGIALLVTISGADKMINILTFTNSDLFEKQITGFLDSIDLPKIPETSTVQNPPQGDAAKVIGSWGKASSGQMAYGDAVALANAGYGKDQYTFNANGTYSFASKTFRYANPNIFIVKEHGTYQIVGENLTIKPQKSVVEAWSKKDGGDKYGKLVSSQTRSLETVTYKFTVHYFSGIEQWNLIFQTDTPTNRDGPHSTNHTFPNSYIFSPISERNTAIILP